MAIDWGVVSGLGGSAAALAAIVTLIYAVVSGRKQAEHLANQTKGISAQTELLRKQIFGEVYENSQIKDAQFFLPEKRKCIAEGFEEEQKDDEEIAKGKQVIIKQGKDADLNIKFTMEAPQRLRCITCGFLDKYEGSNYLAHPKMVEYKRPFTIQEFGPPERKVYCDWSGFWHIEFFYPRFFAKDDCFVLCFALKAEGVGKFPFHIEITTEEARGPHKEVMWVEVAS